MITTKTVFSDLALGDNSPSVLGLANVEIVEDLVARMLRVLRLCKVVVRVLRVLRLCNVVVRVLRVLRVCNADSESVKIVESV